MKRSTKQLLSLLLAIVMVCGLMAPALAARPMGGDVAETPVTEAASPKASHTGAQTTVSASLFAEPIAFNFAETHKQTSMSGEVKITDGTDMDAAVELWLGNDTGFDWKPSTVGGDNPGYIVGKGNPLSNTDAVDTEGNPTGKKAAPTPLTTVDGDYYPVTGGYFKFVAKKAGALELKGMMNGGKQIFLFDAGTDGAANPPTAINGKDGSNDTKLGVKADPYYEKFAVEEGHTYYFFCTGSKAGLYGFTFEEGATVDSTPVITITSPAVGAPALTKEFEVGAEAANLTVTATITNAAEGKLQYTWYQAAGDTAAPATDTKVQDPATTNKNAFAIDTSAKKDATKYYCVVSADGATSVTSEVFTVTVKEKEPEPTELVGGSWTAKDNGQAVIDLGALSAETKVTTAVTAVDFYVGPDTYKFASNGDMGDGLTGNANCQYTDDTGAGKSITAANPVPDRGTYYKWVAKEDGILTIKGINNGASSSGAGRPTLVTVNGTCVKGYDGTDVRTEKTVETVMLTIKKDDVVTFGVGGGTKPQLLSYDFVVQKTVGGSWTAKDNGQAVIDLGALSAETAVKTDVTGLKFYVGPDTYKFASNGDMGDGLTGNANCQYTDDTGAGKSITADHPVPDRGTYYKWVIEEDGTLTIKGINNGASSSGAGRPTLVTVNGTCIKGYDGTDVRTEKTVETVMVSVKKGDVVTFGVGGGTKPQLLAFDFSGGAGGETVVHDWTKAEIFKDGTSTVTPAVKDGAIEVTVVGPKVGSILEGGNINVYADEITIGMYSDGTLIETKKDNGTGDTHKITFKPVASGSYTFKASAVRKDETSTLDTDMSAAVDFTLPLGTPAISSAASNGLEEGKDTASASVMWASVAEATAYNVQIKEHDATEWGAVVKIDAPDSSSVTYIATGLTVGKAYDIKVQALRNTEEGAWSEVFTTDAIAGVKQIAWVEKVFGTSATATYNRVISPETQLYKRNEAAKKDEAVDVYTADGGESITVNDNGDYTLTLKGQEPRVIEGLTGDLNTDPEGRVLLSSHEGAGKIKENEGADGALYYYTAIPAGTNYTLTADVEVLRWITRDTQNGVGLVAMDRVADKSWTGSVGGNADNYWNNVYYAGAMRGSFSHDVKTDTTYSNKDAGYEGNGTKYSYYMGPFATTKIGVPMTANGPYNGTSGPKTYYERRFPLDTRLAKDGRSAKFENTSNRFNLIGNYTVAPKGFSQLNENGAWMSQYELTKFKIQLQKNNTGYISTIWDETGTQMLGQNTEYFVKGAMDLSGDKAYHDNDTSGRKDNADLKCLDKDFEYVGLFTSRDIDALFTNVKLTTIPASQDAPEEEPPYTSITPTMSISSGANSNSENFTLSITANVEGTVTVKQNGVALDLGDKNAIKYDADGNTVRLDVPVTLTKGGNSFEVTFTPDPDQVLPAFTKISSFTPITKKSTVTYNPNYKYLQNIYVAPNGRSNNYGTKSRPLDIYTAVSVVSPGQNIILKEGVYNLTKSINIGKAMSGTDGTVTLKMAELDENGEPKLDEEGNVITKDYVKDATIVMLADVDENGNPVKVVLNGQRKTSVLSLAANYWVLKDFEVVGSTGTGVAISGSHNVAQNLKTHDNLSTGLQISAGASDIPPTRPGEDKIDGDLEITDWGEWPCYNTVINCDSYRNYDNGYGGADGFGAKERVGCGNVFDGCVAYWNADDGWDMYAKTEPDKGPLGRITVKNSITFENGYEVRVLNDGVVQYEADGYTPVMNYDADGKIVKVPAGNGNGFKMGGSHLPGAHSITNSFAFYNKVKGFDSNNGPDIKVSGCTAYNNGEENVGLGTKFSAANYLVEKTVSFKDDKMTGDKMKDGLVEGTDSTVTVNTSKYDEETYYKWDGTKSANAKGTEITAANFVSLDFDNTAWVNGAVRDAQGALNLGDFLKLTGVTNAGAVEEKVDPETPVETPDNVINPPVEGPQGGNSGGSSGGVPGTIGDLTNKEDKPDDTKPVFKAEKTTDKDGNTEIVVKNGDGETVADVKIPAEIPSSDVKFDDAIGHWAEDSIDNMAALGVVNGVGDNLYGVEDDVTRGALATMLFRFANGKEGISNTFADVADGQWYTDAIGWAVMTGVVTGYNADEFGPNDRITREQMAVMLARFAKLVGLDATASSGELAGFKDVSTVSSWAVDGMSWCVKNGIIKGVSADSLSPDTYATRAQTAVMLDRFIALMK